MGSNKNKHSKLIFQAIAEFQEGLNSFFPAFRTMRFYLDSNVLISFLRSEIDSAFNLRFQEAEGFFIICGNAKIELVISDLTLEEVNRKTGVAKKDQSV